MSPGYGMRGTPPRPPGFLRNAASPDKGRTAAANTVLSPRGLYQLNCTPYDGVARFPARSAARRDAGASQAARDDVRKPRNAALRVAFLVPSGVAGTPPGGPPGRREGFPIGRHRLRLPSYRGNGTSDRMGALSPMQAPGGAPPLAVCPAPAAGPHRLPAHSQARRLVIMLLRAGPAMVAGGAHPGCPGRPVAFASA